MPPSRPDQHSDAQPKPVVIGTAGHVDHGKSTLVKALTGIEPDRLAEEQARSMTIDLGFAWFTLPSGRVASIVDVPGHEHFIKNMLAGIGGIDLAMLVVAADEGPMPQTREHLAILDLLGIERGVVVLSRADLADAELLNYVDEEVRELLSGTTLAESPVVSVSAVTGAGIAELSQTIDRISGEGGQSVTRDRAHAHRPGVPLCRGLAQS
ncbi:MAG: GTP-binding protein [Thermomicrobiales bacterium]